MAGNAGDQPDVLGQWLATRSAVGTATADTLRGRVRTDGPSALEQRRASGGPDSEDDEEVSGDAAVDLVDLDEEPEPAPVAGDEPLPERLDPLLDYRVPVVDRPRRAAPAPDATTPVPAPAAPAPAAPAPVAPRSPEPDARSRMHGLEHAFQDVLAAVRAEPAPAARTVSQPAEDTAARERAEAEAARADQVAAELRAAELKEAEARAAEEAQRKAEAEATAAARAAAEAEAAEAAQRKAEAKAAAKAAAEARAAEEAQRKLDEAQRKADAKAAAKAAARAAADAREAEETQRKADEAQRKADARAAARAAVEAREAEEAQRKLDESRRKADEARRKAEAKAGAKAAARTKVAEPPATPSAPSTRATPSGKSAKESAEEFAWKHPLAPTAPEGPRIHPDVHFKPRRAAQHLASLLMVVTAPLAGYAGWLAYEERTRTNLGVFAILAILTVAIWALRISAAPASVRVVQGILEIDDSGKHYSWDLSSSYTPIEVFGTPGRLRWKVWLHTPGGATYVVHSGVVKPREFMRVLRQYRPES